LTWFRKADPKVNPLIVILNAAALISAFAVVIIAVVSEAVQLAVSPITLLAPAATEAETGGKNNPDG
jgi:hypothetical protein